MGPGEFIRTSVIGTFTAGGGAGRNAGIDRQVVCRRYQHDFAADVMLGNGRGLSWVLIAVEAVQVVAFDGHLAAHLAWLSRCC
jgi:hypothetical protein